jgi:hypothetical protein
MHEGAEDDLLLLNNHPDHGGVKVDLVVCTANKNLEIIAFAFADKELEN